MNRIKSIYKAIIYEHENGKIDISYECDCNRNDECSKKNCSKECCTHTFDKKYAKNYKDNIDKL